MGDATSEAHYGEEDQEMIDKEWEEFAKLVKLRNKRQEQAFYPCPPQDEDYVNTIVRKKKAPIESPLIFTLTIE